MKFSAIISKFDKIHSMKLYELEQLSRYLHKYKTISHIKRIENNLIEIVFDKNKDKTIFVDMTRSASTVYIGHYIQSAQEYKAPFDKLLEQFFTRARIVSVDVPGNDRIIRLTVAPPSRYIERKMTLRLEFTGRHTNAIIVDENNRVIEALHHIDSDRSYRVVKPGEILTSLPKNETTHNLTPQKSFDIVEFLEENRKKIFKKKLNTIKKSKIKLINKKIDKIKKLLNELPEPETLSQKAIEYRNIGNIILANLHNIKEYDRKLITKDFEGSTIEIPLPENIAKNRFSEHYFNLAKKAEAKSARVHLEKKNLESKLFFYENILGSIESSEDPYAIESLMPKKGASLKKKEKLKKGELYWIEGYKVLVGRNSSENQYLLEAAKANDIWMHIRGVPSSHLIIKTDKQNLPDSLLYAAAKLCVDTSVRNAGDYEVDYTRRKFVKIQEGSRVEYDKYDTIRIRKDGIEIRV